MLNLRLPSNLRVTRWNVVSKNFIRRQCSFPARAATTIIRAADYSPASSDNACWMVCYHEVANLDNQSLDGTLAGVDNHSGILKFGRLGLLVALTLASPVFGRSQTAPPAATNECAGLKNAVILLIRHAEKPPDGAGLTPAGQALVSNGIMTAGQLTALGAVTRTIAAPPSNNFELLEGETPAVNLGGTSL